MHTLGLKTEGGGKEMAVFWVIGPIKYASLEYGSFNTWNVKVDCEMSVLDGIRNFLKTQGILGDEWVKNEDPWISMSSTKNHVRDQISLMDDGEEKEWMESLCNGGKFPFTYDGIADRNPNPGHDIEEFRRGRFVAVEFSAHAINFKSKTNPEGTFNYNFRLRSIYLVDGDQTTSTSIKRKRDPDEWVVSPPRTRKSTVKANQMQHSTTNSGRG